jgi:uncharacterized protein (TIGR00156 family)
VLAAASILAAFVAVAPGQADYVGPNPAATPVARILQNPVAEQLVVVRGQVIKRTGFELYRFKDGSGEITVEIDAELFPRAPLKADTPIELRGRVETGWREGPRLEALSLTVLPPPPREAQAGAPPAAGAAASEAPAAAVSPPHPTAKGAAAE